MPLLRRPRREDRDNHERWLVSYADFITLLFAFFVVMYAISSVNEGKYRVVSKSLGAAFTRNSVAEQPPGEILPQILELPIQPIPGLRRSQNEEDQRTLRESVNKMAKEIAATLGTLVREGKVSVTETPRGVVVELNASLLFPSGEAKLDPAAESALVSVAKIVARGSFPVLVEGHTDPTPIATAQFPSNWELSGARASRVVRLFIASGVAASRLSAAGYADQQPLVTNDTADGRARNRRVAILLEAAMPDLPPGLAVK